MGPLLGHATIDATLLRSLMTFPLESRSSHLRGTAEPCFALPEKLGAVTEPAGLRGDRKPTKLYPTVYVLVAWV